MTKRRRAIPKRRNALVNRRAIPSGTASTAEHFALEIRVRGKTDHLHQEVCKGLEDALRIGQKWFKAFQARNPWFVQDSKRKRIFILLDPETEGLVRS
jgi:hypothetical protein